MDPSPTQHGSIQFQAKPPRKNRCKKKRRGREDALSHLTAAKPAVPYATNRGSGEFDGLVFTQRECVDGGSAGIDAEGDFAKRLERGKLTVTGDGLHV
jgi:hypothetical protein